MKGSISSENAIFFVSLLSVMSLCFHFWLSCIDLSALVSYFCSAYIASCALIPENKIRNPSGEHRFQQTLCDLVQARLLAPTGSATVTTPFSSVLLTCHVCPPSPPPFDEAVVLSPPNDFAFRILLNGPFITPLCQ